MQYVSQNDNIIFVRKVKPLIYKNFFMLQNLKPNGSINKSLLAILGHLEKIHEGELL